MDQRSPPVPTPQPPTAKPVDAEMLRRVHAENERPEAPPAPWRDSPFWSAA